MKLVQKIQFEILRLCSKIIKKNHNSNSLFCYFAFWDDTIGFKNLIVLRTFSKSYGLAGLRAGYLVANKYLCQNIFNIKAMYEMTSLISVFVEEILKNKNIEKNYILYLKTF